MSCGSILMLRNPLSPSIPIPEEEIGWDRLESAPIRAESNSAMAAAREVDVDDLVEAGTEAEAQLPRGVPAPLEPSPAEIAKHNLTHFPYRSWCPHCLACRRPNAHHRQSRSHSATRKIPLFCADYCFVKESHDEDMATVLAGRLYPSMAVLATVCDTKGPKDERALARLTTFIKESGYPRLVYKSDQERAIAAMIEEALRQAGRTGVPEDPDTFESGLSQAICEHSAVGESASNGRAERTVQAVEDLLRTLKSALEARIKIRIASTHPVMRWMVEHVASILNRCSVNKDGQTPYFAIHGKRPTDRLVEFWEKVFFFVPKKARAKLDHRWRLGIFIGVSTNSNESYIGLSNGNVVKSRSVARVVQANRWDPDAILKIKGIPGDMVPSGTEDIDASIEESHTPHLDGDIEAREKAEVDVPMDNKAPRKEKINPKMKITNRDLRLYGYTAGCERCESLLRNPDIQSWMHRHHSDECRLKMYLSWKEAEDPKWDAVKHLVEPDAVVTDEHQAVRDQGVTPRESVVPSDFEVIGNAMPVTPARSTDAEDHDMPSDSGRWNPASHAAPASTLEPNESDDAWMFFPDTPDTEGDLLMDGDAPFNLDDPVSPQAMVDALIMAGTNKKAAKLFTYAVVNNSFPTSFMEVYGRGSICADANGPRRALNIEGLGALDIRTYKPNGDAWNFDKRSDRNEARRLIDERQPTWIIGSPPCTPFSIWNRNLNYKHMDKERVRNLIAEGRRHLAFVTSLYRKQMLQGRHFLHEHPASALSWSEPGIAALARHPNVHCVVANQCQYGLTTPAEGDKTKRMPALKPTRFMSSSPQMAAELNKRCPKIHTHQQLVGGRCAEAAFYPLALIRAILTGMRNTAIAEGSSGDIHADEKIAIKAMKFAARPNADVVQAVMNSNGKPGQIPWANSAVAPPSTVKLLKGGTLPVGYEPEHFKAQYIDEYTGEILPTELIRAAMVEELNYFNERVWEILPKADMYQHEDFIFVRSRWVMCNKGDALEPDCRARLVACEVNKTGEKNDLFYASTPPLEAKKAMFNRYAQHARAGPLPLRLSFVDVRKAYFNGTPKRNVFMSLPKELGLPSHYVAKQVKCVYGTRDAGAIWEDVYRGALEAMGFTSGVASPCCFVHEERGLSVVVHGDDFTALGDDQQLDWYETQLAQHFEIKIRGRLGEGCPGDNELRILNRVVKITPNGLTYEADPRHTDLLAQSLNLSTSNSVSTPGQKDAEPCYEGVKDDEIAPVNNFNDLVSHIFTEKNADAFTNVLNALSDEQSRSDISKRDIDDFKSKILHDGGFKSKNCHDVSFSQSPDENFHIIPYSEIYGCHPSLMKATREGMKSVSSTVDPFTSKSGAVMTARSKKSNDRNAELIRAQQVRKMIIAQHFVADSSNVKTPESLDSTLARLNALRTKPIKKGNPAAKRQGAKAVKKMERDAHADFLLSREEASLYRALAARANYLSQDRPDINFATKELCREFSAPNQKSYLRLKRLVRYLVGLPRLVYKFDFIAKGQTPSDTIELYVDTDFAGCRETRRSTSGGVALVGGGNIKHWAKTQSTIALSSGEAELNGIGAGIAQGLGIQSICKDLGYVYKLRVHTDATAAIGIARRRGMGKIRHLDTTDLWVQEVVRSGRVELCKVLGAENPADIFTKYVERPLLIKMLDKMNMQQLPGRAACAPAIAGSTNGQTDSASS